MYFLSVPPLGGSTLRRLSVAALTALGLCALVTVPVHAQGLNSQPVNVSLRSGTSGATGTVLSNDGTKTIIPAGVTFPNNFTFTSTLITPTQIRFTNTNPAIVSNSYSGGAVNFFGYAFSETGPSPVTITGFSIDPSTTVVGFTASRVSFDATDVFLDINSQFSPLVIGGGQNITLNILTAAPVPEASTTVSLGLLLALGMGGMVVAARKKRQA